MFLIKAFKIIYQNQKELFHCVVFNEGNYSYEDPKGMCDSVLGPQHPGLWK